MIWWKWWKWEKRTPADSSDQSDRLQLVREIRIAHQEWLTAQRRLDYVLEQDQIDYAIYALEAAEKRYEMLLKQAKKTQTYAIDYYSSKVAGE